MGPGLQISDVWKAAFGLIPARLAGFIMIGALLYLLPAGALTMWAETMRPPPAPLRATLLGESLSGGATRPSPAAAPTRIAGAGRLTPVQAYLDLGFVLRQGAIRVAVYLIQFLGEGALIALAMAPPGFGWFAAVRQLMARAMPMLGLRISQYAVILVGLVLLAVPGIFAVVIWSVAAPVLLTENRRPWASLARSQQLTKGFRWPVLGCVALFFAGYLIGYWVLAYVLWTGVVAISAVGNAAFVPAAMFSMRVAFPLLWSLVGLVVLAALSATLYRRLVRLREGLGQGEVEGVFA
jgi:hypothetical protein